MVVEFRCEKCGKLLSVDAEAGAKVRCQYCKAKLSVPEGLASLPRPQVPGAAPPPLPGAAPVEMEPDEAPAGQDVLMDTMAKLMPWVLSLFVHAGVLVILAFLTMVMYSIPPSQGAVIPDANYSKKPGGRLNPGQMNRQLRAKSVQADQRWDQRDDNLQTDAVTENTIPLLPNAGQSGATGDLGWETGGSGRGPKARFIGTGGNAHHIVLVVDRSGSMLGSFEQVRMEMISTITQLQPIQTFHILLFANGMTREDENPPRSLVYANAENMRAALKFLESIQPTGGSPTNPLDALERAFQVLANPPDSNQGKLLFLLTDGEFHDNQEVRRRIKAMNSRKDVLVNTILYGVRSKDIEDTLREIAKENGGTFKIEERDR